MTVEISVTTDDYPYETSWILSSSNGITETSQEYQSPQTQYVSNFCLDPDLCHTFTISDSWGDGIYFPGDFSLSVDNAIIISNPIDSWSSLFVDFGTCNIGTTNPPTDYPTVYVPPPTAPTPTPPVVENPCKKKWQRRFTLYLKTDLYGAETSFKLFRRVNGKFKKKVFARSEFGDNKEHTRTKCLGKNGCYKLKVYDTFGDGMCCSYGVGVFQGYWDGQMVDNIDTFFEYGSVSESRKFGKCY